MVDSANDQTHADVDAMYEKPMSRRQQRNAARALGVCGQSARSSVSSRPRIDSIKPPHQKIDDREWRNRLHFGVEG